MNVYTKLNQARIALQSMKLNKSGHNKFAGYHYFELGDFLPSINAIFAEVGLCSFINFSDTTATLTIVSTDDQSKVEFSCPMANAELKGCHPVQNLGASITYIRRYLYTNAMEIVEHDALDATTGKEAQNKPVEKPTAKQSKQAGELLDKAVKEAEKGVQAFRDFWMGLDKNYRETLQPELPRLQSIAEGK